MKRILLVQDDRRVGVAIIRLLKVFGYTDVTWIAGVSSLVITNCILQGIDIDSKPAPVNLNDHGIALLDGRLKIGITDGWALVGPLKDEFDMVCVGMSTMYNVNFERAGVQHLIDPGDFKPFIETKLAGIYAAACGHA